MTAQLQEEEVNHNLSARGWANVAGIMPRIKSAVSERMSETRTSIDLSTAENWLIRPELVEMCREAMAAQLRPKHLSYANGFFGEPALLDACSGLLNRFFSPRKPVERGHLATAPGAMAAIDTLLFNICENGEGVIIPGPYWNGFDFGISVRAAVKAVVPITPSLDLVFDEEALVKSLEDAYESADCTIKAVMITNPHNPLAICYPRHLLEACVLFCERHGLHFISDEVYALSVFPSPDLPIAQPFTSVLSLDLDKLGVDPSRVHAVWSMSKDFGQSGVRVGFSISQSNQEMLVGCALAAQMQVSNLTALFATAVLTAPNLDELIQLNAKRLVKAYTRLTTFFKACDIPYIPCNAGLYVFARIAPKARTWDEENAAIDKLKESGVLVSAGKAYHGPDCEKGWARVGFAVEEDALDEAIERMKTVFVGNTASHALGTDDQLEACVTNESLEV